MIGKIGIKYLLTIKQKEKNNNNRVIRNAPLQRKNVRTNANSGYGKAKIIAVVNKASWCPVCKVHGQNAGMIMMPYTQQGLAILMNDLTDDQSNAAVKKELTSAGVYYAVKATKETGVVIFVDAKTHKKLGQTSIAISDEGLKKEIEKYFKS